MIDSQISIYWAAAHAKGHAIETTIYDVIRKPTIAPRQIPLLDSDGIKIVLDANGDRATKKDGSPRQSADSKLGYVMQTRQETPTEYGERLTLDIGQRPDFYYARQEIPRLQADLDEGAWDVWQTAKMIRECQKFNRWPRNTSACVGFGRCQYFKLCTGGYDPQSSETPDGFVVVDNVHPELS